MYTVLVCDDDIAIQNSIKIYLENEGYNVLTASDGEECIKVAENNEVHCLILDIMMPKIWIRSLVLNMVQMIMLQSHSIRLSLWQG